MKNKKRPTGFRQPAREFSFQLQPPTNYNNGDEIVLTLIEDGVTTTWKTYLFDSVSSNCIVIIKTLLKLNRVYVCIQMKQNFV